MTRWLLPVLVLIPVLGLTGCKKDPPLDANKTAVASESKPESKVASNKHHKRRHADRNHDKDK